MKNDFLNCILNLFYISISLPIVSQTSIKVDEFIDEFVLLRDISGVEFPVYYFFSEDEEDFFQAKCRSYVPIEIKIEEFHKYTEVNTNNISYIEERTIRNIQNKSSYLYEIDISIFFVRKFKLARLDCIERENSANFDRIYIANKNPFAFTDNKGRSVYRHFLYRDVPEEYYGRLVPCLSANPMNVDKIELFVFETNGNLTKISAKYNFMMGFIFDEPLSTLNKTFLCKLDIDSYKWSDEQIDLYKDIINKPYHIEVTVQVGSEMVFSCETFFNSNDTIKFRYNFEKNEIYDPVNNDFSPNSNYSIVSLNDYGFYKSKLLKFDNFGEQGNATVMCQIESEQKLKRFYWEVSILQSPHLKIDDINVKGACYLTKNQTVNGKNSLTVGVINCPDPTNCKVSQCYKSKVPTCMDLPSSITKCGTNLKQDIWSDDCFQFDLSNNKNGVIQCGRDRNNIIVTFEFFTGLYSGKRIIDWRSAPLEDLIRIQIPKYIFLNGSKIMNENELITCSAVKFLFTKELKLFFIFGNESEFMLENRLLQDYFYESAIKSGFKTKTLVGNGIKGISCYAPWRNSSDWINTKKYFDYRNAEKPKFLETETNKSFEIYSEGFLNCSVEGYPNPDAKFFWLFNETEFESSDMFESTSFESILTFEEISIINEGEYTCMVHNEFGIGKRKFYVKVHIASDSDLMLYVYLGIGLVIIVALSGFLIIWAFWKKTEYLKREIRNMTGEELKEFFNERIDDAGTKVIELRLLKIPFKNIKIGSRKLGEGAYGIVYTGFYDGDHVAIKTTNNDATIEYFKALISELKINYRIGEHENIVKMLGACTEKLKKRKVWILFELGLEDLSKYLKKNDEVSLRDMNYWSSQIAAGMEHLSCLKIIHGDLAARNIILFEGNNVKITDFGLARKIITYEYLKKTDQLLPLRWMAPESIRSGHFSIKSDVWSYAVTVWEIFSFGKEPFEDNEEEFPANILNGERLKRPENMDAMTYSILNQCWDEDPSIRPNFEELVQFFIFK